VAYEKLYKKQQETFFFMFLFTHNAFCTTDGNGEEDKGEEKL
jgi:hypothetical protein